MRFPEKFSAHHSYNSNRKVAKIVESGGTFSALLTDSSETFDCLSDKFLIAKLDAYGFEILYLK